MKISVQNLNALPVQTWRWLNVNNTSFEGNIPTIEAIKEDKPVVLPQGVYHLEEIPENVQQIQTAMGNNATQFVQANSNVGFCLLAKEKVKQAVSYTYDASKQSIVEENYIVAQENSSLTVLTSVTSTQEDVCFHAACTRIYAQKGAKVRLIQIQRLNNESGQWNDVGIYQEEGSDVEVVHIELGADRIVGGCLAKLAGKDAQFSADTIYLGMQDNSLDFNYIAEHVAPSTTSDISASGALLDNSQKVYRGTIDFKQGAMQAVGREKEHTLLFSPHTVNKTSPLILCQEEDVEGQHAASIGRIDEKKLFYLQSRGLTEVEAKKLLIEGTFLPTIQKVPDESLQEQLFTYLTERIVSL